MGGGRRKLRQPRQAVLDPFLLLYNRFTGLLRAASYIWLISRRAATIRGSSLPFSMGRLLMYTPPSKGGVPWQPLKDYQDRGTLISTPNDIAVQSPELLFGFWIISQRLANCDPCNCQYYSRLGFRSHLQSEAERMLEQTGNGQVIRVFSSGANNSTQPSGFIPSVSHNALTNLSKGARTLQKRC